MQSSQCIYIYIYIYSFYLKKVATTACFIREESSGGYIYIYILDPENFDREKYIYMRHFEICYVILRTQIHHMLYVYAKVVMRWPNLKAYGHLVDVLLFKWPI